MKRRGDEEEQDEARRTAALMGVVIVLMLAIAGVTVVRELGKTGQIEDCLLSGRTNCLPIAVPFDTD